MTPAQDLAARICVFVVGASAGGLIVFAATAWLLERWLR